MKIGRGLSVLVIAPLFVLENKERGRRLNARVKSYQEKPKL
jgi:hypothetical protein